MALALVSWSVWQSLMHGVCKRVHVRRACFISAGRYNGKGAEKRACLMGLSHPLEEILRSEAKVRFHQSTACPQGKAVHSITQVRL